MCARWQANRDRIANSDRAAANHHAHHARELGDVAIVVNRPNLLQQAFLKVVDLAAGISQAGDDDNGIATDAQRGPNRQPKQIETGGGDVLTQITGRHIVPLRCDVFEELLMDEVHLAQIGLCGVDGHPRAVLHLGPGVRIACDADAGNQLDRVGRILRERVMVALVQGGDGSSHDVRSIASGYGSNMDANLRRLEIIPVPGLPEISPGDDLAGQIISACTAPAEPPIGLLDHDVLVVSQKVVSKAENKLVKVDPSDPQAHKPIVLEESVRVVRRRGDLIISQTKHGFVCASAGIDRSNVASDTAVLLPDDSDRSARRLRDAIAGRVGVDVGIVVADTFGRPWRRGLTDVALGCAGIMPILDLRGTDDAVGRELQVTEVCIVDELAGAAELVRGKSNGIAVAIIRGVDPAWFGPGSVVDDIVRDPQEDLFR